MDVRLLKRRGNETVSDFDSGKEAKVTHDVEGLLQGLAGRGAGRLILRTGGISLAKRMAMDFWPGSSCGILRLPGFEIFTKGLVAVCRVWPENGCLAVSVFDDEWRLRLMLAVPGIRCPEAFGRMEGVSLRDGILTEGGGAGRMAGWEDLWPELSLGGRAGPQAADLAGQVLTVNLVGEVFRFTTEFKVSVVDLEGTVVRMSDRPRSQVCYSNLGLIEESNGGLWMRVDD